MESIYKLINWKMSTSAAFFYFVQTNYGDFWHISNNVIECNEMIMLCCVTILILTHYAKIVSWNPILVSYISSHAM